MHYIFNENNKIVGFCDFEPDQEDLKSRNEFSIFTSMVVVNPVDLIVGKYGTLLEPASYKTDEQKTTEVKNSLLVKRKELLLKTDYIVSRHIEQKMLNLETTLSEDVFNSYLRYRQSLRDITNHESFPYVELPNSPT